MVEIEDPTNDQLMTLTNEDIEGIDLIDAPDDDTSETPDSSGEAVVAMEDAG